MGYDLQVWSVRPLQEGLLGVEPFEQELANRRFRVLRTMMRCALEPLPY
jgi:hypothetical protein